MKPIMFTRADVALMVRVALFFNPGFGTRCSRTQMRLMACGRMKPRVSVLCDLNLSEHGEEYQWNPS